MEALEHQQEDTTMAEPMDTPRSALPHDSMVTVRLSEPPSLTVDTRASPVMDEPENDTPLATPIEQMDDDMNNEDLDRTPQSRESTPANINNDREDSAPRMSELQSPVDSEERRGSDSSAGSRRNEVNWEELQKTEDEQPRDQDSEDSTALLLARLEQENNLLVTNPKSGLTPVTAHSSRSRSVSRPPSIQHLKNLVNGPTPSALRYSLLPAPPMTDLEFYAALVQDYKQTAQRLPTLLSKKIRSGVPPPLRGVVWQSMSGARDPILEDQFDRLCGETSPYDGIIGKDIGRSFPGVEMFRDPEGDGQRMLGRVLKCFSLYDHKIGYCQGLGFLVGPLLMHMGDKQAFCVLVRLMEHYDLRNCFLPDLSGLHVRIFQFKELLKRHLPALSSHLDVLQIEPAYVSQWFLSFFAVTCPLPMLFRIYDVIFAEGASETIMRVALSVMRKNEEKILACTEFEDVMQLLLSRGLWDVYHYNADEFVSDFVSLTGIVTNESLQGLEAKYRESKTSDASTSPSSDVGSAATRFLGRLWSGSNSSAKSASLSPGLAAPSRPVSFLRRSNSKQSIASTLNSMDGGSDSMMSSASTDVTTMSRDSANTDSSSVRATSMAINVPRSTGNKDRDLHGQIEDLLMALREMQRDHATLATQLEREREEREEDRQAITSLLDGLRKRTSMETIKTGSEESLETVTAPKSEDTEELKEDEQESDRSDEFGPHNTEKVNNIDEVTQSDLSQLLDIVELRFAREPDRRMSSTLQSKSQMRDDLVRVKEQLIGEVSKSQDLIRRLSESEHEVSTLKDQVRDGHTHVRNAHQEKQRLEKQIQELRARQGRERSPEKAFQISESEWPTRTSGNPGLRELKLGRSASNRSQAPPFSKRASSLITTSLGKENETPVSSVEASPIQPTADNDALILELVQAKTAEAVAKQEAEEAKAKLESLRKMLGLSTPDGAGHKSSPSQPNPLGSNTGAFSPYLERANTTMGSFAPYLSRGGTADIKAASPPVTTPSSGGSFWGGWGKRSVSVSTTPMESA